MSWEGDFITICPSTAGQPSLDKVLGDSLFQRAFFFFHLRELRVSARDAEQDKCRKMRRGRQDLVDCAKSMQEEYC